MIKNKVVTNTCERLPKGESLRYGACVRVGISSLLSITLEGLAQLCAISQNADYQNEDLASSFRKLLRQLSSSFAQPKPSQMCES